MRWPNMRQTLKHNFSIKGKLINEIWMSCTVTYDTKNIEKGARNSKVRNIIIYIYEKV